MPESISNVVRQEFSDQVHIKYQASGKLKDCVYTKTSGNADAFNFPNLGETVSQEKHQFAGHEQPGGAKYESVKLTPRDFYASEFSDIFSNARVNFDDKAQLAKILAKAIGRRCDQLIIDGLVASGTSKVIGKGVGGSNTGLNVAKLRATAAAFDDDEIEEDITFVGHSRQKENLLGETEVTSSDYASVKALTNGEVDEFMGMKFKWVGNRKEGGLPLASTTRTGFAFAQSSTVMGVLFEKAAEIDWVPLQGAWYVVQRYSANAKVRDALGVVQVETHQAA